MTDEAVWRRSRLSDLESHHWP